MRKSAAPAREGKGVIVAPIAFVSEHSETLVELDIEYGKLARESGVPDYRRAATVSADPAFIDGLAGLVRKALADGACVNDSGRPYLSGRHSAAAAIEEEMMDALRDALADYIAWILAFHIIAVIAWMAACSICRACSSITPRPSRAPKARSASR